MVRVRVRGRVRVSRTRLNSMISAATMERKEEGSFERPVSRYQPKSSGPLARVRVRVRVSGQGSS